MDMVGGRDNKAVVNEPVSVGEGDVWHASHGCL